MKKHNKFQSELKIPTNVQIEKKNNILFFTGPLGITTLNIEKFDQKGSICLDINDRTKTIRIISSSKSTFGSFNILIKNKLYGISQGFILYLRMVGIGYRCSLEKSTLRFKVGFSHDVKYKIPNSIRIFLPEPTLLSIFGIDKNQVTQIAAQIRCIKPPSPYKGKGIRLITETVRIKQGKQK